MLQQAAGVGMALISSEHFFSSLLTSPMTTKRFFADTEEGRQDTLKALRLAIGLSLVTGTILGFMLKSWLPVFTVALISAFYWTTYNRALKGTI